MSTPVSRDFVIYKAQGQHVPDMILTAMTPCPAPALDEDGMRIDSSKQAALFREQGREIAAALRASLPGGTVDALLVELLQAKASLLVVRG